MWGSQRQKAVLLQGGSHQTLPDSTQIWARVRSTWRKSPHGESSGNNRRAGTAPSPTPAWQVRSVWPVHRQAHPGARRRSRKRNANTQTRPGIVTKHDKREVPVPAGRSRSCRAAEDWGRSGYKSWHRCHISPAPAPARSALGPEHEAETFQKQIWGLEKSLRSFQMVNHPQQLYRQGAWIQVADILKMRSIFCTWCSVGIWRGFSLQ